MRTSTRPGLEDRVTATLAPARSTSTSTPGAYRPTTSGYRITPPARVRVSTAAASATVTATSRPRPEWRSPGPGSLNDLRESRVRIMAAADEERRRIERDLHDGAQQRLVALRIRIELAAEAMAEGRGQPLEMLRQLGTEAEVALEEIRSLAQGIYPAPLANFGLAGALRAAALCGPVHTTVVSDGDGRYPREMETAAYFCCLEAMQNAAKHAREATGIRVELIERDGVLRLEVRDDGPGFDPKDTVAGNGLTNMRDRLATVGGELEIRSARGAGTRVVASIPLDTR
jgi:signal transduction histidine kinase